MIDIKIPPQQLQSQGLLQITARNQIHLTATKLDPFFSKTKLIKIHTEQIVVQRRVTHRKQSEKLQLLAIILLLSVQR